MCMLLGRLRHDLRHIGHARSRRLRPFRVGFFGLTHQLVGLFLRHLPATYHVLHEITGALDGEPGKAGCCADDVLHVSGNLASGLLTYLLRTGSHLGNGISNVGAAVARRTARSNRSGRRPGIERSGGIGGQWLVGHGWSHSECAYMKGPG